MNPNLLQKLNTKSFEQQTETLQNKVRVSKVLAEQIFSSRSGWKSNQKGKTREIKIKHEPVALVAKKAGNSSSQSTNICNE